MQTLSFIFRNHPLNAALLSWIAAQVLKTLFMFVKNRKIDFERLVGAGGMPSAHSATVCALTISVARREGVGSTMFAIVIVLAAVVMYDAMGVRRAAGEQAKRINEIAEGLKQDDEDDKQLFDSNLKEYLGHTPLEVLAGAMLGILTAMFLGYSMQN
ncbi:MAG: divergent PAP2 family protein [Oscillospiraceae bacterium]|nr:divergent PAP2 family protein [Oscillospiraceae bacterium]